MWRIFEFLGYNPSTSDVMPERVEMASNSDVHNAYNSQFALTPNFTNSCKLSSTFTTLSLIDVFSTVN